MDEECERKWKVGGKKFISNFHPQKTYFSSLGYTVFTQMCYCTAEIKINSFVSCDLFISQSTGLWLSVILMKNLRLYYQVIRLCQALFYFLISLVQGEALQPWWMSRATVTVMFLGPWSYSSPLKITVTGERGRRGQMVLSTEPREGCDGWGPCCRTGGLKALYTQSHGPGHLHCRTFHDFSRRIYSASTDWWSRMFPV